MSARTAAAPRYHRRLGLATVLVVACGGLGFAASQALAGQALVPQVGTDTTPSSTVATTTPAPIPDPQPAPNPDPKPSRPKQRTRVTPQPPPAARPVMRRSTPRTTSTARPAPPRTPRPKTVRSELQAAAVVTPVPRRPRIRVAPKVRRQPRTVRRTRPVVRERTRESVAAPTHRKLALGPAPTRSFPSAESPPSGSPLVFLLLGLGMLLVGASAISARRVPWPDLVEPLEAHRLDLATAGIGAIALALLWLNFTVFL